MGAGRGRAVVTASHLLAFHFNIEVFGAFAVGFALLRFYLEGALLALILLLKT